ncbi:hypothetical protein BH10PSE5_BH10PSE5_34290 [soil metagenome]
MLLHLLRHTGFNAARRGATFVGVGSIAHTTTFATLNLPAGTQLGDIAIVVTEYDGSAAGTTIAASTGWAKTHRTWDGVYDCTIHLKALDATDISNGNVLIGNTQASGYSSVAVYRNAAVATLKTDFGTGANVGPTLALTGFARSAGALGVIAIVSDRDPGVTPTAQQGWVVRTSGNRSALWSSAIADVLDARLYVSGATIDFAAMQGASNFEQHGWVVELT